MPYGDRTLVSVVNPRCDIHGNASRVMKVSQRRTFAVLLIHFGAVSRCPAARISQHGPVFVFFMTTMPRGQIGDSYPRTGGGPDVRMSTNHQHGHVPTSGRSSQVDSFRIDGKPFLRPGHSVQDVLLRFLRSIKSFGIDIDKLNTPPQGGLSFQAV